MANIHISYEHYLAKGQANHLRLLMRPEQLPESLFTPVLWQCLLTGSIEDRSYHAIPNFPGEKGKYGSHGQLYWANYSQEYKTLAQKLGIEFLYDEIYDFAPSDTRSPVKWRGRTGNVVTASLHKLKYGKMPHYLRLLLAISDEEDDDEESETELKALLNAD